MDEVSNLLDAMGALDEADGESAMEMSKEYEKGGFPSTSGIWFCRDNEPEIIYPGCSVHIDNDRICEEIKRSALESTKIRETAKEIYEKICEIVNG